jgi:hypothetical protein
MVLVLQSAIVAMVLASIAAMATLAGMPWPGLQRIAALVALLHGLVQQIFLLYTVESRSHGTPVRFAAQSFARAVMVLMSGSLAALVTRNATTILIAETLASLAVLVVLSPAVARRNGLGFGVGLVLAMKRMPQIQWRPALMLLAAASLAYLQTNADRWVATSVLDRDGFAAYSFAWILLLAAGQAQVLINSAAFPWMARRVARAGTRAGLGSTSALSALMLGLGTGFAIPLLFFADWAVPRYWPHLAASVQLLPIFAACAVLRMSDFWSSFLLVTGKERHLVRNSLVVGALVLTAALWMDRNGTAWKAIQVGWLCLFITAGTYLTSLWTSMTAAKEAPC